MTATTTQQLKFAGASDALVTYLTAKEALIPAGNPATAYVTSVLAPPNPLTTFVTPLVFDATGSTGGLYAWTGTTYVKVGLATT